MYPSNPGFGRGLSFWDLKTDHATGHANGVLQAHAAGPD